MQSRPTAGSCREAHGRLPAADQGRPPRSRPGTAGNLGSSSGQAAAAGGQWACQQQQAAVTGAGGAAALQQLSSLRSLESSSWMQSTYNAAYSCSAQQLQQLVVPGAVSALPASLLQLHLAHNQFESAPAELPAALPALTMLDLSYNRLRELPVTIGALVNLQVLLVGHNSLVQLPGSISRLQQLHTLHAGACDSTPVRTAVSRSFACGCHLQVSLEGACLWCFVLTAVTPNPPLLLPPPLLLCRPQRAAAAPCWPAAAGQPSKPAPAAQQPGAAAR